MTVKRETLAWCAGVLDSNGSVNKHGRSVRWQVHASDLTLLERLAATLGGHIVGPYSHEYADGSKRRPRYVWHIDGPFAVSAALRRLRPWLSERKIDSAESALGTPRETHAGR